MSVYVVSGLLSGSNFLCLKASATLPVKLIRVDAQANSALVYSVSVYTGGGTITGGTTPTPVPLRSAAPAALSTVKLNATAVSGTLNTLQPNKTLSANSPDGFTPPGAVILGAGSSSVLAAFGASGITLSIWFDELEIQPGY